MKWTCSNFISMWLYGPHNITSRDNMSHKVRKHTFWHVHLRSLIVVVHIKKLCFLGYPKCAWWRFWSNCKNVQTNLNFLKYWFFRISPWKHMLWFLLEAPHRGISNEYSQHMFSWRTEKNIYQIPFLIYCAFDIFQKVFFLAWHFTQKK